MTMVRIAAVGSSSTVDVTNFSIPSSTGDGTLWVGGNPPSTCCTGTCNTPTKILLSSNQFVIDFVAMDKDRMVTDAQLMRSNV